MTVLLSSIPASPSVRLSTTSSKQLNESGVIATPYSIGGKILSYLAGIPIFRHCAFSRHELHHNEEANAAFINAIRDGLGEYEAESARLLLGLNCKPGRAINGLTAHTILTCIGANQQQLALSKQAIEPIMPDPEVQRTTLEVISHHEVEAHNGLSDDPPSVAGLCCLLTRNVSDTDVLLMRTTMTGSALYLEKKDKVTATPALLERATNATGYINTCPAFKPYLKELCRNSGVTAADLRRMSTSAFENELKSKYRALEPSMASQDEICRTPTEVTIHWISMLQEAMTTTTDESARSLITGLLKGQQTRWMEHNLTIKATTNALQRDSDVLRSNGLSELADVAACRPGSDSASKSKSLLGQLPASVQDTPLTRLHDNIYGRVFESRWIANLVDNPPEDILSNMQKIGVGVADLVADLPLRIQQKVIRYLQKLVANNARFWFGKVDSIDMLARSTWPGSYRLLQKLLQSNVENGQQCIAIPYLSVNVFIALKKSGVKMAWIRKTNKNYSTHIHKNNGRITVNNHNSVIPVPTAGITLRHQPAAVSEVWMTTTNRPSLQTRPRTVNIPMPVQQALLHGIPYANGVSGSTNIMLGIIAHLRDEGKHIDPQSALLGITMFLNYDGGHSIHEVLWVANQCEPRLNLQLRASPRKRKKDKSKFISNYESFQSLYAAAECRKAVADSLSKAWTETIEYFRNNSYFTKSISKGELRTLSEDT
ncbi:TPA: hypothetical protein PC598_003763 [Morganella morganii]|nr:hypothetical protein [Morganella morganii]